MAYFARRGDVHAVVTEDSDLLTYGCPRVFFKMDKAGYGEQICLEHLHLNKDLPLLGFTYDMFMEVRCGYLIVVRFACLRCSAVRYLLPRLVRHINNARSNQCCSINVQGHASLIWTNQLSYGWRFIFRRCASCLAATS